MSLSPTTAAAASAEPPLSLSRVQRADPLCCELLDQAGHCALYQHSLDRWVKCHRHSCGRLVLYRRTAAPLHAFAVVGCGPDRVQPLAGPSQLQLQSRPPFLLFGPGPGVAGGHPTPRPSAGVWFRDEADCNRLAGRMARLMGQAPGDGGGIVDMLGRAQAEYEAAAAATAAAGAGFAADARPDGDVCEMVARRIRQQLGLAQPEETAATAAASGSQQQQQQQQPQQQQPQQQQQQQPQPTSPSPTVEEEEFLLTPGMLESPPSPSRSQPDGEDSGFGGGHDASAVAMTTQREQLRQSLLHLLERDDSFISSVHRAYVASLQRRLGKV